MKRRPEKFKPKAARKPVLIRRRKEPSPAKTLPALHGGCELLALNGHEDTESAKSVCHETDNSRAWSASSYPGWTP